MGQASRLRDIVSILENSRRPVPRARLLAELEISPATFKRDLELLRDQFQAPVRWVRGSGGEPGGYQLEDKQWSSGRHSLPQAWFSSAELYALLTIDELARHIGPGLLTEHIQPLVTRVTMMLGATEDLPREIRARVRILTSARKRTSPPHFETIAGATIRRRRLHIVYYTRGRNESSERLISPQMLLHYQENWYLIAWCHSVNNVRMFALDAIVSVAPTGTAAKNMARAQIDAMIGRDFGLAMGRGERMWAKLEFNSVQARWVANEIWHPEQRGSFTKSGTYLLEVPYSHPQELIMEILRFGPEVVVHGPTSLRREVGERLRKAAGNYRENEGG